MKLKIWIVIAIGILLLVSIISLVVVLRKTAFLTQRLDNVTYVIITQMELNENNWQVEGTSITLTDRQVIEKIFNAIQSTKGRRVLPSPTGGPGGDPSWILRVHYQNGEIDEINLFDQAFFRRFPTSGLAGDSGYVLGINAELRALIEELFIAVGIKNFICH